MDSSGSDRDALAVHTVNNQGHRSSVLKTAVGDMAYPSHVPPPTQAVEGNLGETVKDTATPTADSDQQQQREEDDQLSQEPPAIPKSVSAPSDSARPSLLKKWQTDLTRRGDRQPFAVPPLLKTARTSYLDHAISRGPRHGDSSSTSSEDDDDDDAPNEKAAPKPKRKDKMLHGTEAKDDSRRFRVGNDKYHTNGKVRKDGRLQITVNETAGTGYLAKALGAAAQKVIPKENPDHFQDTKSPASSTTPDLSPRPRLNIVIMVIGSRGDAQPFLKVGKVLKEQYGHRVRIATHPAFREFVEKDSGLEFFSVGGDPAELMAFMVKNPGMIPTLETVKAGDIGRRRAAMAEMFDGFWRACINATDDEKDSENLKMMGAKDPFVADAIIANPPSFAHVHCAEALGIPLHLMFTFPYTPTQAFPHPLASIKTSNVDPGYTNFISYPLVEMMVWRGLGDLINEFRVKTLNLDTMSTLWAPGATYRLHVPFTYLWSPGLVPKPADWGPHIDISGFVFLDLASTFDPPQDLEDFLAAGEPPVYIGFGSIVVDDADRFTQMIFEAVKMAGVRALVSKGWGGLGGDDVPDNIYMLENTPHDWLFPRVRACVIHGGAGTTAMALKCGKPTLVVPFFGDQHFWGSMIAKSNVGPEPIPYKYLDVEKLAEGIKYCMRDDAQAAATKIAADIEKEGDGAENAVKAFHSHLNLRGNKTMRCSIFKDKIATWEPKNTRVKLSPQAADLLVDAGLLSWKRLRLLRHTEWNDFEGPGEPVTGIAGSVAGTVGDIFKGIGGVPYRVAKSSKKRKGRRAKKALKARAGLAGKGGSTGDAAQGTGQSSPDTAVDSTSIRSGTTANEDATANEVAGKVVDDVTTGLGQTAAAIAKAPVNLSVALAQGFHNAPRLYGDDTVRKPLRVTGIHSGLRAARLEFGHGIYDAFTGVVLLPVRGAKSNGVTGFAKGTGMGLSGFVLKNLSAIVGPFGYALKGVVKQAERGKGPHKVIRRARISQGQRELRLLDQEEQRALGKEAIDGWHVLKNLCDEISLIEGQRGLVGQIEKVRLDTGPLFEDVEVARRSIQALKKGETLEHIVHPDRDPRTNPAEFQGQTQDANKHDPGVGKDSGIGFDGLRQVQSLA